MNLLKVSKTPQGHWLIKAMFFETSPPEVREKYTSFTLKDQEHNGYPSLKQIYLQFDDPTEYEFAQAVFGSYAHWKAICAAKWFIPYVEDWRDELEIKLRSRAIKQMADHATTEKGFSASRWLAEGSWKEKTKGRPSKEQAERDNKVSTAIDNDISSDLTRLRAIK